MRSTSSPGPIFIVGMPRSGTTLLAAMLNAHPRIAISPETFFLEWALLHRRLDPAHDDDLEVFWSQYTASEPFAALHLDADALRTRFSGLSRRGFDTLFLLLLEAYATAAGKSRAGEKTPRHYLYLETIFHWYPAARVVFMVRDPRATVSSLLRVPWAADDAEEHAWRWRHCCACLERWRRDPRVIAIAYEEVVVDPDGAARRLCDFLGEPFHPGILEHWRTAGDLVGAEAHKENVLRPIDPASLDAWRRRLDPVQVAVVEEITRASMRRLGYEPEGPRASLGTRIGVRLRRLPALASALGRRLGRLRGGR